MSASPDRGRALFTFRAYSAFAALIVGVALFAIWSLWITSSPMQSPQSPSPLVAGLVIAFDLVLLIVSVVSLMYRVWDMRFYEDAFTVRARHTRATFDYSRLRGVQVYALRSAFRRQEVLRIEVDSGGPFMISGNPWNKALGIDLYRWLKHKSGPADDSDAGDQSRTGPTTPSDSAGNP